MSNHLYDGLTSYVYAAPDRLFATLPDGRKISYGDIDKTSGRLANLLLELGVEPGDRVAVQVDKSIEALMLYLASLRAGAVFLPLNTAYTAKEVDYFVTDAEPRLVVCRKESRAAIQPIAEKVAAQVETLGDNGDGSLMKRAENLATKFENIDRAGDDLAAILYTSGTTGRSKGAMLSHDNLLSNCVTLSQFWRFDSDDVLLHALPIYHTHGLFVASNIILANGARMFFLPKFDASQIIRLMPHATTMMGVPTFYTRLLDTPAFTAETARNMRLFVSGSAPLLAETHRNFSARTGQAILERYGMTETNMNTSNPYADERRAGTVGFALPGVDLRIVDSESGNAVAQGEIGVIEIKGPNVFQGYWRMPEKTAEEFRSDGFFITGDLGQIDERGYISIVGRGKDLIISGGFNVYPKEIEDHIDDIPGVLESAVIGLPHPDFGESVAAVIVRSGEVEIDEATISTALKDDMAKFKQPKRIFFIDTLPRNTMGKVQKNVLREEYKQSFAE